MKSYWPTWVADWRTFIDNRDSYEAEHDALESLVAAEEYLAWLVDNQDPLKVLASAIDVLRVEVDKAFEDEDEDVRHRSGAEIYEKIGDLKINLVSLWQSGKYQQDQIAPLRRELIALITYLLIRVFRMSEEDINPKSFHEIILETGGTIDG